MDSIWRAVTLCRNSDDPKMADAQELLEKIDKRVKYRVVAQLDFDRLQNGKKQTFLKTTFTKWNICNIGIGGVGRGERVRDYLIYIDDNATANQSLVTINQLCAFPKVGHLSTPRPNAGVLGTCEVGGFL